MPTKGKFSDRRCSQRRHDRRSDPALATQMPDQNRRHDARRCDTRRHDARRQSERQNISFEVLFDDQSGKSINVSASGVYFEVATNDIEAFSPGTTIPIQINTVTAVTPYSRERKLKLTGEGLIIRNYIIENPGHENSLGIAVKFVDKLNIRVDSD